VVIETFLITLVQTFKEKSKMFFTELTPSVVQSRFPTLGILANVSKDTRRLAPGVGLPSDLKFAFHSTFHVIGYHPPVTNTVAIRASVPRTKVWNGFPCMGAISVYWYKLHDNTSLDKGR
jgi:hypothetical protein